MAEFTELFPMGREFEGWLPAYQYTITFDLPLTIVLGVLAVLFFCILYQILYGLFYWVFEMRPAGRADDLEGGILRPAYTVTGPSYQLTIFQAMMQNNLWAWRMLEAFERDVNGKRGDRLREWRKLPPLVSYGGHDNVVGSSGECVICLDAFKAGELCQVFPVCKHIFHSNCIDRWLMKKLTCPICRCYVIE